MYRKIYVYNTVCLCHILLILGQAPTHPLKSNTHKTWLRCIAVGNTSYSAWNRYIITNTVWTEPVINTFNPASYRITFGTSNTNDPSTLLTER